MTTLAGAVIFGDDVRRAVADASGYARELKLPSGSSHRLVRLAEVLDRDVRAGTASRAADVIELMALLQHLNDARGHPLWPLLFGTLRSETQFDHQVLMLGAWRILRTWGNAVDLVPEGPEGDLVLRAPPVDVLVEVKAPDELTGRKALDARSVSKIVAGALNSSSHQRRGRSAAVMMQGGFRVPLAKLDELKAAWMAALTNKPTRSAIVAGIAFTLGADPTDIVLRTTSRRAPRGRDVGVHEQFAAQLDPELFHLRVSIRVGENPSYRGAAPIIRPSDALMGIRLPA